MSDWKDVERELGAKGPAEALAKIAAMWGVINAARYLVRWWDHPDIRHKTFNAFIAERETQLRKELITLDGDRTLETGSDSGGGP